MPPASWISSLLVHPLFLLVAGGLLTTLLLPSITRRWQNRQKALELKAGLLSRLSDAVTRLITHAWFTEFGGKGKLSEDDRKEFDWRYGEWEVETSKLQAQLQAYFKSCPGIARQWTAYREALRKLHHLSWEGQDRKDLLEDLAAAYNSADLWRVPVRGRWLPWTTRLFRVDRRPDVNWRAFTDTTQSGSYMGEPWSELKTAMEAPLAPLANAILYAKVETM